LIVSSGSGPAGLNKGHFIQEAFGISPGDAAGGTDQAAGRGLALPKPLYAEVALGGGLPGVIKLHGPERAGQDAFPAADADFFMDKHHPLLIPVDGFNRAGFLAGRVGTMMAIDGNKGRAFLHHPDKPGADPEFVLLLAGHFAGMAATAVFLENSQLEFSHCFFS